MTFRYSQEHLNYLRHAWPVLTLQELCEGFYLYFGVVKTLSQLRAALKNHKIKSNRSGQVKIGSLIYTATEIEFIKQRYSEITVKQLVDELNIRFKTNTSANQLKAFLTNHKIHSGRTGRFEKGRKSWNKGTKGLTSANKTSFKKGSNPANQKPFGHERICSKDGFILMKVDMVNPYTGFRGHYVHKHRYVWEQHNGVIPKGHIIRFKDGDKMNCEIGNLEMVTKAENLRLNQRHYNESPEELKPTIKALAQLEVAAFSKQKSINQGAQAVNKKNEQ